MLVTLCIVIKCPLVKNVLTKSDIRWSYFKENETMHENACEQLCLKINGRTLIGEENRENL